MSLMDDANNAQDPLQHMLDQFLDADDLARLPPVIPLVGDEDDPILLRDSLCRVNGQHGAYKSFALLDMAAHIGSGLPWMGRDTVQGLVIYLVGEGVHGMA
jgi:hypothetical protein